MVQIAELIRSPLLTALLAGALLGLVVGIVGTAGAFLRVFKKHYVIPDDQVQAELAELLRERDMLAERRLARKEAEREDADVERLVDKVMQLPEADRKEMAADLDRKLAEKERH